uniref:NADH-ubiquinone oxidoreductase chain 2 n=1 Tax=Curtos bilineatus TaxID=370592 RepID=A0A5C0PWP1_9COLE|nr:NADH dehydrogenase subunit 2 [Curtos bilineatus]QEJ81604.1 NADH dehydrogenase subunit 2 [Curtos bilineatus]
MMKIYKLIFGIILIMGTMISISAYSWLGMWIGLEINLLSIIPIIMNSNILSSESSIKYFITQTLASMFIMMSIIVMMWKLNFYSNMTIHNPMMMILNSSLLIKMGMAPFHFWFPEVLEGLNWFYCMIMLTWQKIAPMMLMMFNSKSILFYSIIIVMGMIISVFMSFNQMSLRKLMAFSSINHMGWMLTTMLLEKTIWIIYFLVYSIITITITLTMKNIFFLNQMFMINEMKQVKIMFILNFMSLSGIPPFLGFLPKWLTIQMMIESKMIILSIMMIFITLIMIFIYMRISMSTLLFKNNQMNWKLNNKIKHNNLFNSMINFFSISSLIIITILMNST